MNHPVRVAERAAALDILSGGRLELGTARSSTWTELGGFNVDPDMTKQTWDEYVHVLPQMWSGEPFSHDGLGWRMPERRVLPTPVQDPHPPLWVTVTTPGTELDAADRGIGCLGVAAVSFAEQERRTAEYRRRIQLCDPVGGVNDAVTTQNFLYCHEDIDVAARVGGSMATTFGLSNSHLLWTREAYPTSAYHSLGNLQPPAAKKETGAPGERRPLPEGVAIGDPARIIGEIERWEGVGIDGINFMLNALRGDPPGRRPGQPATVRRRSDAEVPLVNVALSAVAEPITLGTAEIFQAAFEHAGTRPALVPPGLVPTNPTLVTLLAIRVPDGPHGGFTFAQVRVSCRSGARARALVTSSAVDASAECAEWLAAGWGIGGDLAPIRFERRFDRVRVTAPAFDVSLQGPRPIGVDDVQYVTGLHPVVDRVRRSTRSGGAGHRARPGGAWPARAAHLCRAGSRPALHGGGHLGDGDAHVAAGPLRPRPVPPSTPRYRASTA